MATTTNFNFEKNATALVAAYGSIDSAAKDFNKCLAVWHKAKIQITRSYKDSGRIAIKAAMEALYKGKRVSKATIGNNVSALISLINSGSLTDLTIKPASAKRAEQRKAAASGGDPKVSIVFSNGACPEELANKLYKTLTEGKHVETLEPLAAFLVPAIKEYMGDSLED